MSQSGRSLLRNVYNKKVYFSGKEVKTSSVSMETNTLTTAASETVKLKDSTRRLLDRPAGGYNRRSGQEKLASPCGGGVEYFHHSPASHRRRRKGKSQIWDSKIRLQVPRDSDPRMTTLARASSCCKRQTHSLVWESAPHQQTRNCLSVIKTWS
jgi:hypothetical protein